MIMCLCEHNEEMLSQNFDPLLRRRDVLLSSRIECDGHGDHVLYCIVLYYEALY